MQSPQILIQQVFLQAVQNNRLYLQIIYQQHDWFVLDDYKLQDIKLVIQMYGYQIRQRHFEQLSQFLHALF